MKKLMTPRIAHEPAFNFEHFLTKLQWTFMQLVLTLVSLGWIGLHGYDDLKSLFDKVTPAHAATSELTEVAAIESLLMTDREFRQKIAVMIARQRKEAETLAKPKTKRRKAS